MHGEKCTSAHARLSLGGFNVTLIFRQRSLTSQHEPRTVDRVARVHKTASRRSGLLNIDCNLALALGSSLYFLLRIGRRFYEAVIYAL